MSEAPAANPSGGTGPQQATVDLLGLLAYAELSAFSRISDDARLAPTLADRAQLAAMATEEFGHYRDLERHMRELSIDPDVAMAPFRDELDGFHERTQPADWAESLLKAYVGDGIAIDFYSEIANLVEEPSRGIALAATADRRHREWAAEAVRAAIAADPQLGGRLALWGRRIVGEALVAAQRVAADREDLVALIAGADLTLVGEMFLRMTKAHAARMESIGLAP